MTKVEELREEVMGYYTTPWYYDPAFAAVDALIAAARAEGVAAERERIVRGSQRFSQGDDVSDSDYITADYATKIDFAAVADCELLIFPASLLTPDKEGEHE